MSQVQNKVKWCLNKAKRELGEGSKHRGLVEIKPNIEEAKKHINKAEHNFKALLSFAKTGFADWSVSAGFYTLYQCLLAIISKFGYESRNQECTIALAEYLKEQNKINLSEDIIESVKASDHEERHDKNAIELRENFQYGTATEVSDQKLETLKELCKKAIQETKKIIYSG